MINVVISRNKDGKIVEFEIGGHANYGEYGSDLVCGAVSILAQTALVGLLEYVKIDCAYEMKDGYLHCKVPDCSDSDRTKVDSILETMILGVENVKNGYRPYVRIEYKEV